MSRSCCCGCRSPLCPWPWRSKLCEIPLVRYRRLSTAHLPAQPPLLGPQVRCSFSAVHFACHRPVRAYTGTLCLRSAGTAAAGSFPFLQESWGEGMKGHPCRMMALPLTAPVSSDCVLHNREGPRLKMLKSVCSCDPWLHRDPMALHWQLALESCLHSSRCHRPLRSPEQV